MSLSGETVRRFLEDGFAVTEPVFSAAALQEIDQQVRNAGTSGAEFRKHTELFAVRRVLHTIPGLQKTVFSTTFRNWVHAFAGQGFFPVKSIWFDKPPSSNWFVIWHQVLTISIRCETPDDPEWNNKGYEIIRSKDGQLSAQPPVELLERMVTLRIHLDDTDAQNGALKVIRGSHLRGICRPERINWERDHPVTCEVPAGAVMAMRPLTLHASARSTGARRRRVLHIEFCDRELPEGMEWNERLNW